MGHIILCLLFLRTILIAQKYEKRNVAIASRVPNRQFIEFVKRIQRSVYASTNQCKKIRILPKPEIFKGLCFLSTFVCNTFSK